MKAIIKRFLLWLLQLKPMRAFIEANVSTRDEKKFDAQRFTQDNLFSYPSAINDGFLHVRRALDVVKSFNLTNLVVLDIGAAGGEVAKLITEELPKARIFCFEPLADTFARLKTNVAGWDNISIHNIALGRQQKILSMNVMSRITTSSILPSNQETLIEGNQYFKMEGTEQIQMNCLDDCGFIGDSAIGLIKIDVQGYEAEVLLGAENTLRRTHFVIVEMQNHQIYLGAPRYFEIDEIMRASQFELFDIIPSIRQCGQVLEYDALYINKLLKTQA